MFGERWFGDKNEEERANFEAGLVAWEQRHDQFEREQQELVRLTNKATEEQEKITDGVDTSAEQLDRHLRAEMQLYHWKAQHPRLPFSGTGENKPSAREENGIGYLKMQKLVSGSYHQEKAEYCAEQAQERLQKAEEASPQWWSNLTEEEIRQIATGERTRADRDAENAAFERQLHAQTRKEAANWLRTQANCLEMPEGKPAAPPPPPDR
jgi:hypothetical protein